MKTVFNIFVFLLLVQYCCGADFRYLRTNEGLYSGAINSITQDKSGKMWFSTWYGLVSYDGFIYKFYKPELGNPLSLPENRTTKIFIDSKDNLWVYSISYISLYRKEDESFHSIRFEGYQVFGFFETKVNVLIYTDKGIFLIYSLGNKDSDFRIKKLKLFDDNTEASVSIKCMNTFNDSLIMVSSADVNNPSYIYISDLLVDGKDTLLKIQKKIVCHRQINSIEYVKDEDRLYLGTIDGISVLDLATLVISDHVFFKGLNIQKLLYASDHTIYCYSSEPDLLYARLETSQTGKYIPDKFNSGSILDDNIMCMFEDFSGNIWVGHQGMGISILNLKSKAIYSFKRDPYNPKSLNGNIVTCFNGTAEDIFIGLRPGGLSLTSKHMNKNGFTEIKVLSYQQNEKAISNFDNIWDIARESDSIYWIASDGGLARLTKTSKGWFYGSLKEKPLISEPIRKIMIDNDRNLWLGGYNGLVFIPALQKNPKGKSYLFPYDLSNPEGISNPTVLSMLVDSKNRFWIGTFEGLNLLKTPYDQLNLSGRTIPDLKFRKFIATKPEKDFLNNNQINCIYENSDSKIWLATQGGGINIMDTDSFKVSQLSIDYGLAGNDVLNILPDQKGIKWIGAVNGIFSIDPNNKIKSFVNYTSPVGLQGGRLQGGNFWVNSFYQSVDGELFFGGDNGFIRFYPDQIRFNLIPPKIGLTRLRIFNEAVSIGDTISKGNVMTTSLNEMSRIELPFRKNSFSIGVGVYHYQNPEGNMIRYKIEGYNDHWTIIPASQKNIYFSNLPSGKYTLHLFALSADNVESISERKFEIRILPPWYQTWYVRTAFVLFLFALVGYIFYWIEDKRKIAFQKRIDVISIANNENKMQFLANIAHELHTPLSLVVAPIEDMKQNYTTIDPKWKNHLDLIYRNSNYLQTLIKQIIDFRKLDADKLRLNLHKTDIVSLVCDVVTNFKGLENRQKTSLHIQVPDKVIMVDIDSQKIEEVLYNLLSNAFKHTEKNHAIEVSLQVISEKNNLDEDTGDQIRITVFNEGKDISDEDKEKIFERFYKVTENIEGAGIGLSFSKSLIEMHNGTISVESVKEIGVAFHVTLPFKQIDITDFHTDKNEHDYLWHEDVFDSIQIHELENREKDMTIVIVEDNIDLRTFLQDKLSEVYNCYEAGDGKEGYDLILRILPDIVISDVVMPKMDGYELCEIIKENNKTCHIPIILLTANNTQDHIISGYNKGADAYVTKPFGMNIITAQISRLIKNRELIREKYLTQNFMVEVSSSSNLSKDDEFIVNLRQLLEDNLSESNFNVKRLSSDLNISTTQLYRKLKALTGLSPVEFLLLFKLQKACGILKNSNYSIKEIGYGLGFNNLSYFVKCFREQFGITPSTYRKNGFSDTLEKNSTNHQEYHKLTDIKAY